MPIPLERTITDFCGWWIGELPRARRRAKKTTVDFICSVSREGIVCHKPSDDISSFVLRSTNIETALGGISSCAKVEVVIGDDACLERSNGERRLPATLARSSAELDLLASTPINAEEVHILVPALTTDVFSYFVVKKKLLDPVIVALRSAGANVTSISIQIGDAIVPLDSTSLARIWPPSWSQRLAGKLGKCALAASLVLGFSTYGFAYARYWRAEADLDEKILAAQIEAKAAKAVLQKRQAEIAGIAKVRAEKSEGVPVISIWSEMTSRLPDDAWLSDLEINGAAISISGFARAASSLVSDIDASPLFEAPTFAGPVVRAPGQESERFSLTARVVRP